MVEFHGLLSTLSKIHHMARETGKFHQNVEKYAPETLDEIGALAADQLRAAGWSIPASESQPEADLFRRGQCILLSTLDIELIQKGVDKFTVRYCKQVKDGLTYGEAASELGAAIMHALACDGRLDNRVKGERE